MITITSDWWLIFVVSKFQSVRQWVIIKKKAVPDSSDIRWIFSSFFGSGDTSVCFDENWPENKQYSGLIKYWFEDAHTLSLSTYSLETKSSLI